MENIKFVIKSIFKILFKLCKGAVLLLIAIYEILPERDESNEVQPYDGRFEAERLRDAGLADPERLAQHGMYK